MENNNTIVWTNSPLSGLCDRLIDFFLIATYCKLNESNFISVWRPLHSNTRDGKSFYQTNENNLMIKIILQFFKNNSKLIGWLANIITIVGVTLTSFDIYPLNIIILALAGVFWVITGLLWKKPELWTLNALICVIYLYGLIR